MAARVLSITAGENTRRATVEGNGTIIVDEVPYLVATAGSPGEATVSTGTKLDRVFVATTNGVIWVFRDGDVFELTIDADAGTLTRSRAHHHSSLTAPMPATVVSIAARPGDRVTRGAVLIVLEAMKMELPVRAPSDGVVAAVNCKPGDLVQPGVPLIEMQ